MMAMSPRPSVGTRNCSTQAAKLWLMIGLSSTFKTLPVESRFFFGHFTQCFDDITEPPLSSSTAPW